MGAVSGGSPAEPTIGGDNAIDQTGVGDEAGRTDERDFFEYTLVARGRSPPRGFQGPVRHGVDHTRRRGRGSGGGHTRAPAGRDRSRPRGHRRGSLWHLPRVQRRDPESAPEDPAVRHALRGVSGAARTRSRPRGVVTRSPGAGEPHMYGRFRLVAALLVVLSLVAGCHSMTGKTAGETIDDATITASVKAKLVADKPSNLTRVDVDTNNATVYLNGVVDSAEQKARAEQLAWQAKGVKSVVNNLQVKK